MSKGALADRGDRYAAAVQGLAFCEAAASDVTPRYVESDVIAPMRTIGLDKNTTLKATFWNCTVEETVQLGDLDFAGIALNTGGRVWRDNETTLNVLGGLAMMPFEGARWRFDGPASFVQLYVPFKLLGAVSESLFDCELRHTSMRMPSGVRGDGLCRTAHAIGRSIARVEPTNLILDSWALILADLLVRRFASHSEKAVRTSFGKIPARGIARVIDYVEANIDQDLDLASLSGVAAMSVYHFARRFKETVGVSPHAYVLSRRVRRAREMLDRGDAGLAHVAVACGFSSQAHFTTVFQRDIGVTPGEYRRAMNGGAPTRST
jgi:AraC family transcriptional regulator